MQIINAINVLASHLGGTGPNEQFGTHTIVFGVDGNSAKLVPGLQYTVCWKE